MTYLSIPSVAKENDDFMIENIDRNKVKIPSNWTIDDIQRVVKELGIAKVIRVERLSSLDLSNLEMGEIKIVTKQGKGDQANGAIISLEKRADGWFVFDITNYEN